MTWFDESVLATLTDPQRAAATHLDGPLLVLAGPGSGKTRVITTRVAWLIAQGVPAWSILALTFTNKAAGEMRQRVDRLVPADVSGRRGLTVTTFHAFCARLLRRYAESRRGVVTAPAGAVDLSDLPGLDDDSGAPTSSGAKPQAAAVDDDDASNDPRPFRGSPRFSIYDARDQRDAIKQALEQLGLDTTNWPPASVASSISRAKNRLIDAKAYAAQASDFYTRTIAKIFTAYQRILARSDAVDFDDLLLFTAKVLRDEPGVRAELQQRFQYLLIDEYQDTNHAQFFIANALAVNHQNICVVGDPDQSIYGWRGADLNNILEFEKQYPGAKVIALGQNFRSTGHIVAAASKLIQHNRWRKHKDLHTDLGEGAKPQVVTCADEHHEASLVVDELRSRNQQGIDWREMAVLYRINALSRVMEDAMRDAGIPYVIARGTAFYERKEIKDALSYLRLIANPNDEVSLLRIINTPARGISKQTLNAIEMHAVQRRVSFAAALREADQIGGLSARAVSAVQSFVVMVDGWRAAASGEFRADLMAGASESGGLVDLFERVLRESGLEEALKKSKSDEDAERLENLEELVSAAAEFEPPDDEENEAGTEPRTTLELLERYLESVALVSDQDAIESGSGAVTLMTLHAAKGLEFDVIAMIGLEEGLLPHSRSATDERELEEERRLCFVGMTRARKHLMMSSAATRTQRGMRERTMESQFLRELPEEGIIRSDQSDAGGYGGFEDDDPFADRASRYGGGAERDSASRRGTSGGASGLAGSHESSGLWMEFPVGALVRHPSFGLGRIEQITRQRQGTRARINFSGGGSKTLILEYAKLQRVE